MADTRACGTCGTSAAPDAQFCAACGNELAPARDAVNIPGIQIREVIGVGGFGTVYHARDLSHAKDVAVKVGTAGAKVSEAYEREARFHKRLQHPRIIGTIRTGTLDDGRPYLVQEWMNGVSLDRLLKSRGRLTLEEAVAVACATAEGLAAAHAVGFIHRDLKPSNVYIPGTTANPQYDHAKLTDFGVVGILDQGTKTTQIGEIYGTPAYMAPEQLSGRAQSEQTDIYGLGVLLYEMIFGRPPFGGTNVPTIFVDIMEREVAFPDEPPVPERVRWFIRETLAKEPGDRPQTAAAALTGLRRLKVPSPRTTTAEIPIPPLPTPRGPRRTPSAIVATVRRTTGAMRAATDPQRTQLRWVYPMLLTVPLVGAAIWVSRGGLGLPLEMTVETVPGIAGGLAIAISGIVLGMLLSKYLRRKRTQVADNAADVLVGAGARGELTASLAINVDQILLRCKNLDERFLGRSLAIMVQEFEESASASDRRGALMDAVNLLEKLMKRLSPWYVRHEKLLAAILAVVGVLGGVVKIADTLLKLGSGS